MSIEDELRCCRQENQAILKKHTHMGLKLLELKADLLDMVEQMDYQDLPRTYVRGRVSQILKELNKL